VCCGACAKHPISLPAEREEDPARRWAERLHAAAAIGNLGPAVAGRGTQVAGAARARVRA
jgi:hypothetical protein